MNKGELERYKKITGERDVWERLERIISFISYKRGSEIVLHGPTSIHISHRVPDVNGYLDIATVGATKEIPLEILHDLATNPGRLIMWIKDQILEFEHHELDEWFRFNGQMINDPHSPYYQKPVDYSVIDSDVYPYQTPWQKFPLGQLYTPRTPEEMELLGRGLERSNPKLDEILGGSNKYDTPGKL